MSAHSSLKVCTKQVFAAFNLEMFLSLRDVGKVVEVLYGENPPPIMIIGHSMGGAIAVHTAASNHVPSLLGLCVIDVVEGKFSSLMPILLHTSKNKYLLVHTLK